MGLEGDRLKVKETVCRTEVVIEVLMSGGVFLSISIIEQKPDLFTDRGDVPIC